MVDPQAITLSILSNIDQIAKRDIQTTKSIARKGMNGFHFRLVERAEIEHLIRHSRRCHNR